MANKPGEANFFPDVPVYPEMGAFMPVYGKFDLTTYIQGASDYEIMAFLVGKYNACLEAYGNITKLSTETITACKQLQDWINSWFTNLDVQEEINKKLDSMVADGSFGTLLHHTFDTQINQQTTNAVTDWLVKNVTPAGSAVAVDKSLSIEGAAADAKSTGTAINSISTLLFTGNGRVWNKSVSTEVHAFNGTATSEFKTDVISNIAAGTGEITGVSYELIKPFTLTKDTDYTVYAYCSAPINGTLRFNEGVDWEVSVKANLNCITGLNEIHFTANKNITVSYIAIENPDNLTFSMWITLDERKVKAQERQVQKAETQDFNYITNTLLFTGNGVVWNKAEPASGKDFTGTTTSEFKTDIIESFEAGTGTTTAVSYELAKPFTLTNETDYTAYLYCSAPISGVIHFNQEKSWYISVGANLDCTTGLNEIHFTANKNITVSYIAIENPSSLKFSMWITLDERKAKALQQSLSAVNGYDYDIIFWGDSLTAGAGGGGTNYPSVCSQILGKSYLNAGVGGENAYLIATRQGADNLIVFGNPNRTYAPAEMKTLLGKTIKPLAQGGESTVNPINIAGQKCRLSAVVSEYEPVSYTISGFNGTLVSETPVGFSGAYLSSNVTSIFMGQNGPQDFAQLSPVIDSMIARTNGKVVIIGLTSGTAAERNSLETNMLTKYGNKYFNAREMVSKYGMTVQNLTPTTADTAAIAEGSVPPSLKSDEVHLNADGYTALGKMLATKIQSLGYFDE